MQRTGNPILVRELALDPEVQAALPDMFRFLELPSVDGKFRLRPVLDLASKFGEVALTGSEEDLRVSLKAHATTAVMFRSTGPPPLPVASAPPPLPTVAHPAPDARAGQGPPPLPTAAMAVGAVPPPLPLVASAKPPPLPRA